MDGTQLLNKHFHIKAERAGAAAKANCYRSSGLLYFIVDVTKKEQEYLYELHQMSQHMAAQGEKRSAVFLPDQSGRFLVTEEKKDYVILISREYPPAALTGRELARFHRRGRSLAFQVSKATELGLWRKKWEERLESLEASVDKLWKEQDDSFARLIIESFSYYMGMAENAIQYVADTEIDEQPSYWDAGTICQKTLSEERWQQEPSVRQPFDWVFDHPARDLAEWIRSRYWKGSLFHQSRLTRFLKEYTQVCPISPFAWRLIFARLLFPVHYFDCVEGYFSSSLHAKKESEEQLKKLIKRSADYEQFLASFYERSGVPAKTLRLPEIPWLHQSFLT